MTYASELDARVARGRLKYEQHRARLALVRSARAYVGRYTGQIFDMESYRERQTIPLCGDFARKVLAEVGVQVPGRLRDLGELVDFEKRQAGDLVFAYGENFDARPGQVGILVERNAIVLMRSLIVWELPFPLQTSGGYVGYRIRQPPLKIQS